MDKLASELPSKLSLKTVKAKEGLESIIDVHYQS